MIYRVYVVVLALALTPLFAAAQTGDVPPDDVSTGIYCPNIVQNLKFRDRDARTVPQGQVTELQLFLSDYFDLNPDDSVTGFFGPTTLRNVQRFQREQNLIPPAGYVGPMTRAKIAQVCRSSSHSTANTPDYAQASYSSPVSVTITQPNTEAYYYYGQPLTVSWRQSGSVPKYSTACVTLVNESSQKNFAFPPEGGSASCVSVSGEEPLRSVTGTLLRTPGYDLSPGAYRAVVRMSAPPEGGKDGALLATDVSDVYFKIAEPNSSSNITVTAPNGGEQWEIGTMNTITWAPYNPNTGVNPSQDVIATLVGTAYGSGDQVIVPSGKASIHWEGHVLNERGETVMARPGSYYIKLINKKTGATDSSNAPFTLLPRSVDLKINGSDGPVSVDTSRPVMLTWSASNVARCEIHNAYPDASRQQQIGSVPLSGSREAYLHTSPGWGPTLYCYRSDGSARYDSVQVNSTPTASALQITHPNGGEALWLNSTQDIVWKQTGLNHMSIALYKNDQWYEWIYKDVGPDAVASGHINWNPLSLANSATLPSLGKVFKIYITGKKSDGTGYVDDKSDSPFSFTVGEPTSGLSSWGQKLGVKDSEIPNGRFRSYFFRRDAAGNPGALNRDITTLDEPYFNYISGGGHGQPLDKQVGAYFVGKFTYGNPSPPITFDLSNPQWDVVRVYIDGQLVHTYGGNTGSPMFTRTFPGGTHTIEFEYASNWHAGTFAARVGRIVLPSHVYVEDNSVANLLNVLQQEKGPFKVAAASVYESGDSVNGDITVNLPSLTSPTVLVFSSYDPIRWRWNTNPANLQHVKAIIVYTYAGASMPDLVASVPVYLVRGTYIGDGNGSMTANMVSQKIGRPVDSFAQAYAPTSLALPPFSASTPAPTCSITSDKSSYTLGENIAFSWTSTNATYAAFVPDTSGKDNLQVPGDKLPASGSQVIPASVLGNPYVTLAVYDAGGQKGTCTKTVSVAEVSVAGPKNNVMSCSSPSRSGLDVGALACYGLWDFGNEFGNDQNMCPPGSYSTASTGCFVATSACQTNKAIASRVLDVYAPWHQANGPALATESELATIASNLQSSTGAVRSQIIRLWEYTCAGLDAEAGVSTVSNQTQYASALSALEGALKALLSMVQ